MAKRDVKGLHKVVSKGRVYWYAWREVGAPRLRGEYGTPEFWASYDEAVRSDAFRSPDASALVTLYRASPDYQKLADSTKRNCARWLDEIADYFGPLSIAQFDRPEKIRPIIRQWRNRWADKRARRFRIQVLSCVLSHAVKPRTADFALQVLSRVLSHAVDPLGKIAGNPCEGIKTLYTSNRSEIIWQDADIASHQKGVQCRDCARGRPRCRQRLAPRRSAALVLVAYSGRRHRHHHQQVEP